MKVELTTKSVERILSELSPNELLFK